MTRDEQYALVVEFSEAVTARLLVQIECGRIPPEWDGYELKQLLADRFAQQLLSMTPKRKRAYNNSVLVHNL